MNRKKRLLLFAMPAAVLAIGAGGVAFTVMAVKDQTYVPSPPMRPEASRTARSRSCTTRVRVTRRLRRARSRARSTRPSPESTRTTPATSRASGRPFPTQGHRRFHRPGRADRPRSSAPRVPRVADLDVPPGDAALDLRGAGGANGQGGGARATGNSRFEKAEIDAFAKRVEAHGGRLIRHVFLRRGRISGRRAARSS